MKSVDVIQEVKILPWAKPSQQPGSETRWSEETKVRSRVDRVGRVCIEPRKLFESCGPERDKQSRDGCPFLCEPRTVSPRWNAVSCRAPQASTARGHRGLRPDHADKGITRELTRASSVSCLQNRGSRGSPPRYQSSHNRKGPPLRRVDPACLNAETTGTRGRAGWRRNLGWTLGSLS